MKTTLMKALRSEARVVTLFRVEQIPDALIREGMKLRFDDPLNPVGELITDITYCVGQSEAEVWVNGADQFDKDLDAAVEHHEKMGWSKASIQGQKGVPVVG